MTHFLDLDGHSAEWVGHVLDVARELRRARANGEGARVLGGRTLAMLFEKPSLRTRVSFEEAMIELGGSAIVLGQSEVGLGKRESAADIARVLSGMVHGIMARVHEHAKLEEMARYATVPVINALSDHSHPCQALADVLTLQDEFGVELRGRTLAFVGDGNNVARSLARVCAHLGMRFVLAAPRAYQLEAELLEAIGERKAGAELSMTEDAAEAVAGADAIYTDTFISMGQEAEKAERLKAFEGYRVDAELVSRAPRHAIVMHCLPAYRGVEITDEVMDGAQSRVFQQAHNRLHAQKGLLAVLLGDR